MKVCLIVEGGYPYTRCGNASFIHALIKNSPDIDFHLHTITLHRQKFFSYQWELPPNVSQVTEVTLETALCQKPHAGKRYPVSKKQKDALLHLLMGNHADWHEIAKLRHVVKNGGDFLLSYEFYHIFIKAYEKKYAQMPLSEYYASVQAMLLPFFYILSSPLPKADVYHGFFAGYAGTVALLGARYKGIPMILTEPRIYALEREKETYSEDFAYPQYRQDWSSFFREMSRGIYKHANLVVAPYQGLADSQTELGCPSNKIEIIPKGVSVNEFAYLPAQAPVRQAFHIGVVARLLPHKDIITLLQAYQQVKQSLPSAHLWVMGGGTLNEPYFRLCHDTVEKLQLADVRFTGEIPIEDYIGWMNVLVSSSVDTSQPISLLEGMAAGRPIISTDVGNCREMLEGACDDIGPAGVLVPPGDADKMAKAIILMAKNPKKATEYGDNGKLRAKKKYNITDIAASYRALYDQFIPAEPPK